MSAEAVEEHPSAARSIVLWITLASFAYAIIRYHIAGPVLWEDFPFFIFNKGVSLAAFLLLTLNFAMGPAKTLGVGVPKSWLNARMAVGITGFLLALIHVLISLLLFDPAIYKKLFADDGTMTLNAGLSMLAGVIAFVVLWRYNLSFKTTMREDQAFMAVITSGPFLLLTLPLGAAHLFFMGYEGWMAPAGWHGGLPPISLVAFAAFAVGYVVNVLGRR